MATPNGNLTRQRFVNSMFIQRRRLETASFSSRLRRGRAPVQLPLQTTKNGLGIPENLVGSEISRRILGRAGTASIHRERIPASSAAGTFLSWPTDPVSISQTNNNNQYKGQQRKQNREERNETRGTHQPHAK